jgi:hypothetical protein
MPEMPEVVPAIVLDLGAAPSRACSSMPPSTLPGATSGLPVLPVVELAAGELAPGTAPIVTRSAGTMLPATTRAGPRARRPDWRPIPKHLGWHERDASEAEP